jgi:hypothetical protein
VVGPAWRDYAGACASTPNVAPTVVTPAIAAPFKRPRLLTVDALSRSDIECSPRFGGSPDRRSPHIVASSESLSTLVVTGRKRRRGLQVCRSVPAITPSLDDADRAVWGPPQANSLGERTPSRPPFAPALRRRAKNRFPIPTADVYHRHWLCHLSARRCRLKAAVPAGDFNGEKPHETDVRAAHHRFDERAFTGYVFLRNPSRSCFRFFQMGT